MGTNTSHQHAPAAAGPVDDVQLTLDAIRRLVRTLRMSATDAERVTGLSSAQTFILQLLAERPAESMNDLAAQTFTDQSSVSAVVSRLEAKGLVERRSSTVDGRRTTVHITDAGRGLLAGRPLTAQARLLRALGMMSPETLDSLSRDITNLVQLMGVANEPATMFFEDDASGSD